MDMEAGKTLTNEEVVRELFELLKKNAMKEQANDVFEICSYVDGLEKKIDSMTEELTNMQKQIKEMQEDTLINNAKKALSEAQERLNTRSEQIKSQVAEVKAQVKSTAKSIVDEAKAKGRAALYRVSEFLGIKKRLLDIRENVRGAIKTTDKDIAKTALLAKGFREAGQTAANAFRTFADKSEVDYSQKEQKHPITKAVLAPMKAVRKLFVLMELHLDASIDKLDNLAMNVQLDKEKHMENAKAQVKSTAKSVVDEGKAKGRTALYRVSEFLGIKKRLLDIRENVRGAIKTTDKDIAKTALLAKEFREAGQTAANAFRTFADKPEVDYSQKEQKHPITKAVLAPMKAVKKMLVSMKLHLDASIDKLDNLAMNVQLDKEKHMENAKAQEQTEPEMAEAERVEAEIVYAPMVAEPQEYQYNADAFEARKTSEGKQEKAGKALPKVSEDKVR